jgi:hypothetical protein
VQGHYHALLPLAFLSNLAGSWPPIKPALCWLCCIRGRGHSKSTASSVGHVAGNPDKPSIKCRTTSTRWRFATLSDTHCTARNVRVWGDGGEH